MGYAMAFGECCACHRYFGFNPKKVPSVRVKGVREPVCRECIELANPQRKAMGLKEFTYQPDAYDPIDEQEL
jgi:hypothetical protein